MVPSSTLSAPRFWVVGNLFELRGAVVPSRWLGIGNFGPRLAEPPDRDPGAQRSMPFCAQPTWWQQAPHHLSRIPGSVQHPIRTKVLGRGPLF